MRSRPATLSLLLPLTLGGLLSAAAGAGTLDGRVRDAAGKPVGDAVVYATPLAGSRATPARSTREVIDQQDKEFVPHVKPLLLGTQVFFPNKDDIRHHVYSFSPAKKFELPLYKGTPAAPVTFDRPGLVVLGCNIHDWMLGYVLVLETPYFATTGSDGTVALRDLPAGPYEVRLWHPRMREPGEGPSRRVTIPASGAEPVEFQPALKPEWRPRRAPAGAADRYR
jgi:plastocyanin